MPRPSKYETHVLPRLESIKAWRSIGGLTIEEIADNLGVGRSAFFDYQRKYTDLADALKTSKEDSDCQVENALKKLAVGYEYEEVKTTSQGDAVTEVVRTKKHAAPNMGAIAFYLLNRRSRLWRDRGIGIDDSGAGHRSGEDEALLAAAMDSLTVSPDPGGSLAE